MDLSGRAFGFHGKSSVSKVMIIPDPEELLVGEVVQFNPSAGCAPRQWMGLVLGFASG